MFQHHGPGIPTMPLVRTPVPRRETLGLMAWNRQPGTMTLCEQAALIPSRAVFCLNRNSTIRTFRLASCSTNLRALKTPYDR